MGERFSSGLGGRIKRPGILFQSRWPSISRTTGPCGGGAWTGESPPVVCSRARFFDHPVAPADPRPPSGRRPTTLGPPPWPPARPSDPRPARPPRPGVHSGCLRCFARPLGSAGPLLVCGLDLWAASRLYLGGWGHICLPGPDTSDLGQNEGPRPVQTHTSGDPPVC